MQRALFAVVFICLLGAASRSAAQDSGEAIFKGKCAMCHGPDGSGKTVMGEKLKVADLRSPEVQKKTDAELTTVIIKGKGKMPANEGKLTKEQVAAVLAFTRDLGKKHQQPKQIRD
jgi:mono/diheme cytochrome c family protein